MEKLSQRQQKIIGIILRKGAMRSSDIYAEIIKEGGDISLVTVKRTLSKMASEGILISTGSGRSTSYDITVAGRIFAEIDAKKYCSIDPDKRYGLTRYNFDLFGALPADIFAESESKILDDATAEYKKKTGWRGRLCLSAA